MGNSSAIWRRVLTGSMVVVSWGIWGMGEIAHACRHSPPSEINQRPQQERGLRPAGALRARVRAQSALSLLRGFSILLSLHLTLSTGLPSPVRPSPENTATVKRKKAARRRLISKSRRGTRLR
ncbi:protein of unknown function [Thiomonas sp. Bio17B3]|nr:protein of unknown function [Thiomonas sp. Bio17B3]VDY09973.1 protein of unknown function [Thiomonas sp. Sup16B3]